MSYSNPHSLEIIIWDVQHGSAAYIKTPTGLNIILDLGTGRFDGTIPGFSPIDHLRRKYNIDNLDELIISHPDLDHIADIVRLYPQNVNALVRPRIQKSIILEKIQSTRTVEDSDVFSRYLEFDEKYTVPIPSNVNPNLPENNGGVNIQCFFPQPDVSTNIENNYSVVTVLSYENIKIVLTGDNESASWNYLLDDPNFINAIRGTHILLAPHHGRESGYCEELFNHMNPLLTIISDEIGVATSASSLYSNRSTGYRVRSRGTRELIDRRCLTTRSDGLILIRVDQKLGFQPTLDVSIN